MPAQRPGRSKQDYQTPRPFLDAVEARFGKITLDLAAHAGNAVTPEWLGQGGLREDALAPDVHWGYRDRMSTGLLWLNPPFGNVTPWAKKCAIEGAAGARIALLTPASVSTEWFAEHIHGQALVLALRPRLSFDGVAPYPKDLMLSVFGPFVAPGFDTWRWFSAGTGSAATSPSPTPSAAPGAPAPPTAPLLPSAPLG